jgi:hypothetical protein
MRDEIAYFAQRLFSIHILSDARCHHHSQGRKRILIAIEEFHTDCTADLNCCRIALCTAAAKAYHAELKADALQPEGLARITSGYRNGFINPHTTYIF